MGCAQRRPTRARWSLVIALVIALAAPAGALAAFPGTDPDESPRANTPNDPQFDRCETDDPDPPPGECSSYWQEQFPAFGFSPDSALDVLPPGTHTQYDDCTQLDVQGQAANVAAGDPPCSQLAGVRADTAWKYFGKYDTQGPLQVGDPGVVIAILDTGIRWQEGELRTQVHLNSAELPPPQTTGGVCAEDDCNNDGAFNVADFADDPRVSQAAGDDEADASLDGSDLIATFSNNDDADANGYVDDIAGWDFFDDDNDPFDASSCCSANGHGTGRAREAAAQTDNGQAGVGMCPDCQIMPLRVWDTFVVPTDFFAMAVDYAGRNGASVVEGAVGGLTNTQFARQVFERADELGLSLMLVSSDINSANHNYPTNYNEAMYVAGALPDSAPNDNCRGPGGQIPEPPDEFVEGCQQFLDFISDSICTIPIPDLCITPSATPPTTSFFRNANLTQYGGKADIVLMGSTGSQNTGQSAGAAGLIRSFARLWFAGDGPGGQIPDDDQGPPQLTGNEVRQLLTMTAEDVLPANTGQIGLPDRAEDGWDTHFGYGRVNLAGALARVSNDPFGPAATPPPGWPCDTTGPDPVDPNCIPPEARLDSPDWFAPINVDRVPDGGGVPIKGEIAAPHSNSGVGSWEVEFACGQQPPESAFQTLATGSDAQPEGTTLATIPKATLETLASGCDGSVAADAGRPAGTVANPWPADPYPTPDPERHAFQLRLTVEEADDPGNVAQYRKTLFAYDDDGNLAGWPRPVGSGSDAGDYITGSGGEQSTRLYDVDGDNELDVILPTSSGELWVLDSSGSPVNAFGGDGRVTTDAFALAQAHPPGGGLQPPLETLRTPAIGDIAGDVEPEIVAAAGEHVYAWRLDGDPVPGFPVRLDPDLSEPCNAGVPKPCFDPAQRAITSENHIKRGFLGSAILADLDVDGKLDVVAGAMDQHIYAWEGSGDSMPGFPRKLSSPGAVGAEIVTSPAVAELDGDERPEIVIATNEVISSDPSPPESPFSLINVIIGQATGANPVYAINHNGDDVPGWPVKVGVAAGDLLPLVLPGHDTAVVDVNDDDVDEVSVSAATSLAGQGSRLVNGDGSERSVYANAAANTIDQGPVLNLADYTSIGNVTGLPGDVWAVKGGLTVNGAANLLATNQNLPFSHVEQAWDLPTGAGGTAPAPPGYPLATDDFQLLSQAPIARVAGSGPGRHVLVGTGMYQLHAYDSLGQEASGWPKFTGGWTQPTPSVGDADGDGDLEVTGYTREGWSFLWDTGVDACDSSNDEWWTWHHDEHGSANYGTDARPPGVPEDLAAQRSGSTVTLSFTAPGDDWMCGTATKLRVLASPNAIQHPGDGTQIREEDVTVGADGAVTLDLADAEIGNAAHVAVLYRDEAGNWGHLASVAVPAQDGGGGPSPEPPVGDEPPGPGGPAGPCANVIAGSPDADKLNGTESGDRINGRGGPDKIKGGPGDDCLRGGRGRDKVSGGEGDDTIHVRGGRTDKVNCGPGDDTVTASAGDAVNGNCEHVKD